ncbi:hypothetical protein K7X08_002924 [Anisodus acutangulus]|uniref:F-box protein n=1 Tax=Anisodus acutangulus TaxID=402998 RepID=A0A9Q1MEF4_9SOLA|nr:hypothetical protein K7X08_002924 [Anisodus acutangulus]
MGNWSDLPEELLAIIAGKIGLIEDFVNFRGVCSTWRSAAPKENFSRGITQIACAVHAPPQLVPLSNAALYHLQHRPSFIASTISRYFASKGWLYPISKHGDTCLFHPFSRGQISLPHVTTLPEHDYKDLIVQAALSASPSPSCSNYTLFVLNKQCLTSGMAFWRPGKDVFTQLVGHYQPLDWWVSITCCNDQLYTMYYEGTV